MRSSKHAIADIRFTDDESTLICNCGESVHTAFSDDLNDAFQDHRVDCGEHRRGLAELISNNGQNEFLRRQRAGTAAAIRLRGYAR